MARFTSNFSIARVSVDLEAIMFVSSVKRMVASFQRNPAKILQRAYAKQIRSDLLIDHRSNQFYIDTKRTSDGRLIFVLRMNGGEFCVSNDATLEEMKAIAKVTAYLVETYQDEVH